MLTKDQIPFPLSAQLECAPCRSDAVHPSPTSSDDGKGWTSASVWKRESLERSPTLGPVDSSPRLPGHPRIKMDAVEEMFDFVEKDLCCAKVDRMAKKKRFDGEKTTQEIGPLHRQPLRGRTLKVMEDPELHLVYNHDIIFVKPLPRYLLSFEFWDRCLTVSDNHQTMPTNIQLQMENITMAALGLLRTYFYLVRHESDFRIAQRDDLGLLPKHISWEQFCEFSASFAGISDCAVSPRYFHGELNFNIVNAPDSFGLIYKLFACYSAPVSKAAPDADLPYHDVLVPYYGYALWLFAFFTVIQGAYQIALSAAQVSTNFPGLSYYVNGSIFFFRVSLIYAGLIMIGPSVWFIFKASRYQINAFKNRRQRRQQG